ncbi:MULTISPECIES: SDR family NAD(P)-dependent oxidoreductase [Actibacterium]|jgi:3-oxoacyl-[acyl-carrier protein] reductase|uniref:3-oxoacyl-[acyl-carrier protein] reductase n=1 Tax=Actibacterium naphthalenivorans TaxID=1614693 RepID=A0A840C4T8_9RHOB|nr:MULTISPECIES: SDR family NAD(P)-dependent oxidoreductase [Actibacterium]ALG89543.1 3-oxoacyl-ACP reductase [Actibacterium sp. EMB200-NS6]MBB4020804.1 3-oxoacyl-[acyl-carrier protein] reductase [Actibacterium naphthalenivorans]
MKTVVITGVSRGLGLATAKRLSADGYNVVGLSRSLSDGYKALMAEQEGRVHFIPFDVGDLDAIPGVVSSITKQHGRIWGLVNNAGIGADGILATMHKTDILRVIEVNLTAPIIFAKYISRGMLAAHEGRIVNISSIIASTGFHGLAAYAASKAGLEGFTRSLSREVGKMGITVNCIAPGYMETEMTGGLDVHKMASIRRRAPLGLPEVEDVTGAIALLLGPDGNRITGTVITVDGGSTA